jgi:hypothetical protein
MQSDAIAARHNIATLSFDMIRAFRNRIPRGRLANTTRKHARDPDRKLGTTQRQNATITRAEARAIGKPSRS